ncbi:MAG TPA: competence/damage-inducible protein A [Flavisolibacter sp.]|nr:competence/damage-inducible protein A [Flavisolibacter sp.]
MKEVNAAIITIGDELLIGQTIDTNSAFIAQELNKIGIWVKRRIAVGDVKEEILKAFNYESSDCEIIIITGGLGPTADDITKPALCEYFKSNLKVNDAALENVRNIFSRMNRPMLESNLKQAEVPHNCQVLQNKRGTAPGMWFEKEGVVYISLPGVPHEMKGMMTDTVLPKLVNTFPLPAVVHKTLLTAGQGESMIAEHIKDFESSLPAYIKLAYLPAYGMVRLRLTGRGVDKQIIKKKVEDYFQQLKQVVEDWLVTDEDTSLEEAIIKILREKKVTLATAESCTGGYIAHLITSIAGSSDVYKGSIISYANEVKQDLLNVSRNTLTEHGAVSKKTVKEMLQCVLQQIKSDYGIATSGIMGPTGGSEAKPVGTVWIAVGNNLGSVAQHFHFRFDRTRNIELTAYAALNMLRKYIMQF